MFISEEKPRKPKLFQLSSLTQRVVVLNPGLRVGEFRIYLQKLILIDVFRWRKTSWGSLHTSVNLIMCEVPNTHWARLETIEPESESPIVRGGQCSAMKHKWNLYIYRLSSISTTTNIFSITTSITMILFWLSEYWYEP